jgi:hypothetical protein
MLDYVAYLLSQDSMNQLFEEEHSPAPADVDVQSVQPGVARFRLGRMPRQFARGSGRTPKRSPAPSAGQC